MGQGYPRLEGVRSGRYKYIRYFDAELNQQHAISLTASREGEQPVFEELFDLELDSMERVNLADDPDQKQLRDRMRIRCHELLLEAKGGMDPPDTYIR